MRDMWGTRERERERGVFKAMVMEDCVCFRRLVWIGIFVGGP